MSTQDTSGPMFPVMRQATRFGSSHQCEGLTVREYAAIQFAAAILSNPAHHEWLHSHDERHELAFEAADSFLKARSA